jgi:uncharacterized protein YejL (UPF0352 family)
MSAGGKLNQKQVDKLVDKAARSGVAALLEVMDKHRGSRALAGQALGRMLSSPLDQVCVCVAYCVARKVLPCVGERVRKPESAEGWGQGRMAMALRSAVVSPFRCFAALLGCESCDRDAGSSHWQRGHPFFGSTQWQSFSAFVGGGLKSAL